MWNKRVYVFLSFSSFRYKIWVALQFNFKSFENSFAIDLPKVNAKLSLNYCRHLFLIFICYQKMKGTNQNREGKKSQIQKFINSQEYSLVV
jgi:hypothetical protein